MAKSTYEASESNKRTAINAIGTGKWDITEMRVVMYLFVLALVRMSAEAVQSRQMAICLFKKIRSNTRLL